MATLTIPEYELLSDVVYRSFETWAKHEKLYAKCYRKLTDEAKKLIHTAFMEMRIFKPIIFDVWYAKNHYRFRKLVRNEEIRILYQMLYNFLADYAHGRLAGKTAARTAKVKRS